MSASHIRLAEILRDVEARCAKYDRHPLDQAQKWVEENDEFSGSSLIALVVAGVRYCDLHGLRIPTGLQLNQLGATVNQLLRAPLTERIANVELFGAVYALLEFARGVRFEIERPLVLNSRGDPPVESRSNGPSVTEDKPDQLVICDDAKAPYIEWQGKQHHGLPSGTFEAFQKMYDAKGKAVGIGSSKPLRKPADWHKSLPEPLKSIVASDGNKGYYLNIFSPTGSA